MAAMLILATFLVANMAHTAEIVSNSDASHRPLWVYKCEADRGCQRTRPSNLSTNNTFETINICRTVCGRFGGIWPKPVTVALSSQMVKFHPKNLRYDLVNIPAEARELIVEMTQVTSSNIIVECFGRDIDDAETAVIVYIHVESSNIELTWDTNEQYQLDLHSAEKTITVKIKAETVFGARHGLETLSQLITSNLPDYPSESEKHCSLLILAGAKVKDRPVYKHRGLTLDTSRNFIPMENIKKTIDGMASTKMNVFHWHVTDSHSFPLESKRVPQFTRYGAYSANEIYSTEEVRKLIRYALVRGVRVMIEIDAPAHAGNGWQWGKDYGLGDLAVCVNAEQWRYKCIQPPCGQLNPVNPNMYRVLKNLYHDIAELLPQPALLHMGGDEVFIECWNSSKEITSFMNERGFGINTEGFMKLWAEFHTIALQSWDEVLEQTTGRKNQPVILWSSELTHPDRITQYLSKERYVIEVWEPEFSPMLSMLLNYGYRVISVPKDVWYLDHGFWGQTKYSNWRRMYSYTLPEDSNVLGGEVAMWSEYIDEQGLDTRIWPRAAAVAERLWSAPATDPSAAEQRLHSARSRLIARGLRPDALSPHWCAQHHSRCL